jgi:HD-GYP domain-containing protein (c-di-GMP phosphodiesterase class II)
LSTFSARTLDNDGEVQASLVASQLERRRPHAFAHSRRVASLSVRVAQLAKLPEAEIRQIFWGALVHDIGELDVPEPIFQIPGPLPTIERKTVDLHCAIGSRWLATTPGLSSLVPYARWHHERFDGTGYPDRRGGHEVPLTVALVGVCDCWDAMTEPRPYRVTYSYDDAVAEMEAGAGRQWSRVLVDWLLETVDQERARGAQTG